VTTRRLFDTSVYITILRDVTSHLVWKEAAAVVATVFDKAPQWRSKIAHGLLNDILIALSGRAIGATVVTRNGEDFRLIQHYHPFRLEVI
jgi:predicted nucleic acid-binding protein